MAHVYIFIMNHPDKDLLDVTLDEEKSKTMELERAPSNPAVARGYIQSVYIDDEEILAAAEKIKKERKEED